MRKDVVFAVAISADRRVQVALGKDGCVNRVQVILRRLLVALGTVGHDLTPADMGILVRGPGHFVTPVAIHASRCLRIALKEGPPVNTVGKGKHERRPVDGLPGHFRILDMATHAELGLLDFSCGFPIHVVARHLL